MSDPALKPENIEKLRRYWSDDLTPKHGQIEEYALLLIDDHADLKARVETLVRIGLLNRTPEQLANLEFALSGHREADADAQPSSGPEAEGAESASDRLAYAHGRGLHDDMGEGYPECPLCLAQPHAEADGRDRERGE
jgi:hypothetical protein